jgi:phosphatidylglycerophosphate synthase
LRFLANLSAIYRFSKISVFTLALWYPVYVDGMKPSYSRFLRDFQEAVRLKGFSLGVLVSFVVNEVRSLLRISSSLPSLRRSFIKWAFFLGVVIFGMMGVFEWALSRGLGLGTFVLEGLTYVIVVFVSYLHLGLVRSESSERPFESFVFPNVLTLFRILSLPLLVSTIAIQGDIGAKRATFLLLTLAALSDTLDGNLARMWRVQSDFGRIADPVADCLFHSSLAVALFAFDIVSPLYMFSALLRFLFPPFAGFFLYVRVGGFRVKSTIMGKVSSFVLSVFVGLVYLGKSLPEPAMVRFARTYVEPLGVGVCLLTVVAFVVKGIRIAREKGRA